MSLLTGLNKLVAGIAGPLLFEQAKLLRGGSYSINPLTGQTVFTPSTEYVKAIEGDYSAFHRQSLDIPDINRKLSILGYQVTTPRPGDRVSIRGVIWEIVRVERDPANALYECEVKPIGADIAGDPGATTNALTPLPGLLAGIAGPLLFGPAVLYRAQTTSINSSGQASRTDALENISGLEVEYTATHRAQAGIPEGDRSILVLGASLSGAPIPGDRIDINGLRFEIVRTQRDPARAVYECQARPVGLAVTVRYATHSGLLPVYGIAATAQLTFFYHVGVRPAFQSVANAAALASASSGSSLPALAGQAIAGAGALAYLGGVLAPYTGNSAALAGIAATHARNLTPLAGVGVASVRVSGVHTGTLAPVAGTGNATAPGEGSNASHTGALPAYAGTEIAVAAIAATQAGLRPPFAGTAIAGVLAGATQARSLPAYAGTGQAGNAASAQSGGILRAFAGTGVAGGAGTASHAGFLPTVGGVRTAAAALAASHAGSLPAVTGTATATLGAAGERSASHAGSLTTYTGTELATAAIAATHTGALTTYSGTEISVNGISATQAQNLPAYAGTATATAPSGGVSFDPWTIHAWDANEGSTPSGIIADAIGTVPLYAAVGTALKNNWDGEIDDADITTLVALPADISDFINDPTCTITFWARYNSNSQNFAGLLSHAPFATDSSSAPVGSWYIKREGSSALGFYHRASGGFQGASVSASPAPANDTWAMYTVRLGANQWLATLNNDHANAAYLAWSDAPKGALDQVLKFGGYPLSANVNEISDGVGSSENSNTLTASGGFRGRFGDIRVHNKILSDAEVNALYAAGRQSYSNGGAYEPEAEALFARMTSPPSEWRKGVINTAIVSLKSGGVWDRLSGLYVFKAADKQSAYLNWTQNQTITESGTPVTHVADQYSEGLTTGDTNFLQTPNGIDSKFTETDAHYGVNIEFVRTFQKPVGSFGTFDASILDDASGGGMRGRMHNGAFYSWGGLDPAHYILSQAGGTLTPYKDGTASSSPITQAAPSPNGTFRLLRGNGFGSPPNYQISAFHLGQSLTGAQVTALNNALQTYYAAIDAGPPPASVKADSTLIKSDSTTIKADAT